MHRITIILNVTSTNNVELVPGYVPLWIIFVKQKMAKKTMVPMANKIKNMASIKNLYPDLSIIYTYCFLAQTTFS